MWVRKSAFPPPTQTHVQPPSPSSFPSTVDACVREFCALGHWIDTDAYFLPHPAAPLASPSQAAPSKCCLSKCAFCFIHFICSHTSLAPSQLRRSGGNCIMCKALERVPPSRTYHRQSIPPQRPDERMRWEQARAKERKSKSPLTHTRHAGSSLFAKIAIAVLSSGKRIGKAFPAASR